MGVSLGRKTEDSSTFTPTQQPATVERFAQAGPLWRPGVGVTASQKGSPSLSTLAACSITRIPSPSRSRGTAAASFSEGLESVPFLGIHVPGSAGNTHSLARLAEPSSARRFKVRCCLAMAWSRARRVSAAAVVLVLIAVGLIAGLLSSKQEAARKHSVAGTGEKIKTTSDAGVAPGGGSQPITGQLVDRFSGVASPRTVPTPILTHCRLLHLSSCAAGASGASASAPPATTTTTPTIPGSDASSSSSSNKPAAGNPLSNIPALLGGNGDKQARGPASLAGLSMCYPMTGAEVVSGHACMYRLQVSASPIHRPFRLTREHAPRVLPTPH